MQSTEQWRPIAGYEGLYEVSDQGNVRSLDRIVYAGRGRTRLQRGGRVSLNRHKGGYHVVHLYADGSRTAMFVHRLVLEAFVRASRDGEECCHNDGDPKNNRLSNLRWDTHLENNRDQIRHGTNKELKKTRCPIGHLLQAPNLAAHAQRQGYRRCLACDRARNLKSQRFSPEVAHQKYAEIMTDPLK